MFASVFVVWLALAWLAGPWLVRRAYEERSFGFVNRVISGRDVHPVEFYLADLARLAWLGTGLLVAVGVALYLGVRFRATLERFGGPFLRWFTIGGMVPARHLVAWSVGCGLALGLAEVVVVAIRQEGFGLPSWETSREIVWMAPVAGGMLFGALGIGLLLLSRRVPALRSVRVVNIVLASLAVYALIRLGIRSVHPGAAALLAAGVGFQIARATSAVPQRFVDRSPALTLALGVLVGGAAAAHHGGEWLAEQRALTGLPGAPTGAPNVVLIVLDTVRAQNMSLYGYARQTTPALERFAAEGATFDLAIAPSPWTLPSHATLFTGEQPGETEVDWEVPLDASRLSLAEVLLERGYATGGFVANLYYGTEYFGLNQGFARWDDHPVSWSALIRNEWLVNRIARLAFDLADRRTELVRKSGSEVRRGFLRWLDRANGRPFFAFLNYIDAHAPYGPQEPFERRFSDEHSRFAVETDNGHRYGARDLAQLVDSYDSAIRYLDDEMERLFAALAERGVLDRTLVIVTSDHGEEFGEHDPRMVTHGNSLYIQALHVPLLMRLPGVVPSGVRVAAPVSLADLPATVLHVLGLDVPSVPGRSLDRYWTSPAGAGVDQPAALSELTQHKVMKPFFPLAAGPMASVVSGRLHYIRAGASGESLFDLSADPEELTDLLDAQPQSDEANRLRQLLSAMLAPRAAGNNASGASAPPRR